MLGSGRTYQGKATSGSPVWGISIVILAVLITLALLGTYLHHYVQDHLRSQTLLLSIEEYSAEQAISEYEAINEGELTPEIVEDVAENRLELAEALGELERLNPGDEELAQVSEALNAHQEAIDEEFRLIEAGQLEQANTLDEEQVDPGFEALQELLEDKSAQYGDDARRTDLIVDVATYGTAFLAAITLIMVVRLWQREQARRSEQEALRQSENRFRSLIRNASDIIMIMDANRTVSYISPAVERVLGYKPEDIVGTDSYVLVHPDDRVQVQNLFADAMSKLGVTLAFELRLQHADGSWRHLESSCISLPHDPAVSGMVINSRDITERKHAEEELRRSEQKFRRVMEHAADALFVHDPEGRIVDVNQRASESLGYTRDELLGMSVPDFEINLDPGSLANLWEEMLPGSPVTVDGVHRRRDGTTFPVEVRVGLFESEGPQLMLALARDVTERKRAEELLQQQLAAMTASIDGMAILD